MQNPLKSLCIVGGGSAGWMAATLLSSSLRGSNIKITLVESPDIDTIGVGESTVPSIIDFIRASQIDLKAFIQATSASFKLGIRFDHWRHQNESYFHPFGKIGKDVNGFDFYQVWLKSLNDGNKASWLDYSTNAIMAEHNRFMLPPQQHQNWVLTSYAHALHLDAVKVAKYLRTLCEQRGVNRIEASVEQVSLNDKGFIESLKLNNGVNLQSDFFIDCTGFNGLLINKALHVGYDDWSDYLPCNRAVTVQTQQIEKPVPYTIASAQKSGWSWKIPLQHRTGNGYVFSSKFCSDDEAIQTLLSSVKGKTLNQPRVIPFVTGKRKKIWHQNCLALGLTAGFVEPLESTAIHLVYKTLVHFIQHFPDHDFNKTNEHRFNEKINADYEEVRDFIILHYCTSPRQDSQFWQWCQTMPIPESLKEKITVFKIRGQLEHKPNQFFTPDSWCSILEGMKIRPNKYHPLVDSFCQQNLTQTLSNNIDNIFNTVMDMPNHHDYIQRHCPVIRQNS
jgi:tryptophan halogenase